MIHNIDGSSLSLNGLIALAGGSPFASGEQAGAVNEAKSVDESAKIGAGKSELTEEEQREVEELQQRDREVRRHEQAHKAAAGRYAGGAPSFEYEVGPDGRRYAVGGEVSIDVSPVEDDPQATIDKMQQVRSAATAPAEPSNQNRQVAAEAAQLEQQARADLAAQKSEEANAEDDTSSTGGPAASGTPVTSGTFAAAGTSVVGPLRGESIIPDSAIAAAFTPDAAGASTLTGKFIDVFA